MIVKIVHLHQELCFVFHALSFVPFVLFSTSFSTFINKVFENKNEQCFATMVTVEIVWQTGVQ